MADDPWANYRQGDAAKLGAPAAAPVAAAPAPAPAAPASAPAAASGDPWANYRKGGAAAMAAPPAAAPPPTSAPAPAAASDDQTSAFDPNWKSSGNAFLDFMSRPRAKSEGIGAALRDYGLAGLDDVSMGYLVPKSLQSDVAQAHANLGVMDYPTAGAAYVLGPGKVLGPLARGAAGVGLMGGALEGAAAGGLGAYGHGGDVSDIAQGAGMGVLTGGAAGALSRFGAPKATPPEVGAPQSSTGPATGMYANKVAAYAPLDSIAFDNHGQAINQAQASIRNVRDPNGLGVDLGIPKDVNDVVTNLARNPVVSGRNLQQASSDLRASGDWTGHRFADAIDNHLDTAQPMSIGGQPTGQIGEAGAAKNAGDLLYGRINDLERLAKESPSGAPGPTPSAVQQTKGFYQQQPDSPQYQALDALQQSMQPKFNWYAAKHVAAPLIGAALGASEGFLNPAEGQNRYVTALNEAAHGGLEGLAVYGGLKAAAKARPGAALNAARYAIGTGQAPPAATRGPLGNALLNVIMGQAASNQSPF